MAGMFLLTVGCSNAAFQPDPVPEMARILRDLADKLEADADGAQFANTRAVHDINGNSVGTVRLTGFWGREP